VRAGRAILAAAVLAVASAATATDDPAPTSTPTSTSTEPPDNDSDLTPWPEAPEGVEVVEATPSPPAPPPPGPEPVRLLLSFDAYYTSAGLYLPIARDPTPNLGEKGEVEAYLALLPRSVLPRFAVLEASVNPLPCLGLLARQAPGLYDRARVTPDLNLVHAVTAGFQEPFALSAFLGNVADYGVPGRPEVLGRGYLGLVVSGGLFHLKDDRAIDDPWLEVEVKLKGDRRSPARKHSWSFRAGVKVHDDRFVTDHLFAGLRRSRVDHEDAGSILANSGIEYRFDLSLEGRPLRHFFLVDKKWPLRRPRVALVLGVGFLWEAGAAYRGALDDGRGQRYSALLRPNLEF
jgi:hypothetical protein